MFNAPEVRPSLLIDHESRGLYQEAPLEPLNSEKDFATSREHLREFF